MSECWAPEPGGRPSFKKLMDLLGDILDEGERDNYLDLSRKFDVTVGKSVGATADNKGYLEGMRGCDYGTQGRYSMLLSVLLIGGVGGAHCNPSVWEPDLCGWKEPFLVPGTRESPPGWPRYQGKVGPLG